MILKIQRHYPDMPMPARAHATDAGMDLTAMEVESPRPGVFAFDTGISIQAEGGFYCEVVPRSSIVKTDFIQANSVGVIDPDYRGRIKVIFRYLGGDQDNGQAAARDLVGTRIAQLLVRRVEALEIRTVDDLDDTQRGAGGFGSTGK